MPLPDVALKGCLDIDLNLLDVEIRAGYLARRLDQPWVAHKAIENRIALMQAHDRSYCAVFLLSNIGLGLSFEKGGQFGTDDFHLLG